MPPGVNIRGLADLALQLREQTRDRGQPVLLLFEDGAEGAALQRRHLIGGKSLVVGECREGDVDQPVGAVESAPQIVVFAIGAAEKGAEAVELDALERGGGAALADR